MPSRLQILTRTSEASSTSRLTTAPTFFTAAGSPVSRPLVTTGSTKPWAFASVVVRASTIASRSPTRRLATAVAKPDDRDRDDTRERELAHLAGHRPAADRIRDLLAAAHPLLHTSDPTVPFGRRASDFRIEYVPETRRRERRRGTDSGRVMSASGVVAGRRGSRARARRDRGDGRGPQAPTAARVRAHPAATRSRRSRAAARLATRLTFAGRELRARGRRRRRRVPGRGRLRLCVLLARRVRRFPARAGAGGAAEHPVRLLRSARPDRGRWP